MCIHLVWEKPLQQTMVLRLLLFEPLLLQLAYHIVVKQ
jgi:hypothetical protein